MKTRTSLVWLLSVAFCAIGCRYTPQTQQAQKDGGYRNDNGGTVNDNGRSSSDGDYNQSYQSESRHHHHHGRGSHETEGNDATEANWTRYDRSEQGGELPYRNNARVSGQSGSGGGSISNGASNIPRHHNSHALTAAPGTFDFYVLNLSWSPEFCQGHPDAAECAQHRAFTLHGLWPQNNNGTYPEDCSDAPGPANPAQYADIYPDAALLQHEWQTHGTCSGLQADAFFSLARSAEQSTQIPSQLAHSTQAISMTPGQIVTLFTQANPGLPASSVAISCGNNYLTAVEVCLDKSLRPESCQSVKSCGATQIRIPPPQ
jgi:ribonuclease T2